MKQMTDERLAEIESDLDGLSHDHIKILLIGIEPIALELLQALKTERNLFKVYREFIMQTTEIKKGRPE